MHIVHKPPHAYNEEWHQHPENEKHVHALINQREHFVRMQRHVCWSEERPKEPQQ